MATPIQGKPPLRPTPKKKGVDLNTILLGAILFVAVMCFFNTCGVKGRVDGKISESQEMMKVYGEQQDAKLEVVKNEILLNVIQYDKMKLSELEANEKYRQEQLAKYQQLVGDKNKQLQSLQSGLTKLQQQIQNQK